MNNNGLLLWVDDEIELLKAHIIFLEKKGYEVVTVSNGADAIEECRRHTFDLVLLDEMMPGLSGLETLQRINVAEQGPGVRCDRADPLKDLMASAWEIGVRVRIQGELPKGNANAQLMIAAMRECATNTVRHAGGSEMTVQLMRTQKADIAVITNNGRTPEGEIVEGGGLSGLRQSVENRHGTMAVRGKPAFRLSIVLPREEESQ